jgi:autotransporter-associated beta strand protein
LILNNTGGITADSSVTLSSGGNLTFTDAGNTNGIRFGATGANTNPLTQLTGTVNLNGGTATLNKIFVGGTYSGGAVYNSYVNLNGSTLKAIANQAQFMQGLTSAKVQAGGAIFDSNTFNITVGQELIADSASGGLEKKGDGTLTLSASNTYTGDTLVNNGTLALSSTGGLKFKIGADNVNNKISGTGAGTLSLDGLFTFDLTTASTTIGHDWNIVDVANLFESYGSNFGISGFTPDGGGILWNGTSGGANYQFSETTGVLTVVPEPNVAALFGGLGTLALLRRRRA